MMADGSRKGGTARPLLTRTLRQTPRYLEAQVTSFAESQPSASA